MKMRIALYLALPFLFFFLGGYVNSQATRALPNALGLLSVGILLASIKWAFAGLLLAGIIHALQKRWIVAVIVLSCLCAFMTGPDLRDLIRYELYLSFIQRVKEGKVPLDPIVGRWQDNKLKYGDIRALDVGLTYKHSISPQNMEYVFRRGLADQEARLILQAAILHPEAPPHLIRAAYEHLISTSTASYSVVAQDFARSPNAPDDILLQISQRCDDNYTGTLARNNLRNRVNHGIQPTR